MSSPPTFKDLFGGTQRTAVHLESRDAYSKTHSTFVDWKAGRPIDPAERWSAWHSIVSEAVSRGVVVRRARIVSMPASEYIRFEHEVTEGLNIAAGEQVGWLPRREASDLLVPANDFWLFDSGLVYLNHFDGEGEPTEPEITEDPELAKLCEDAFESVWSRAIPHAEFRIR
ncbi:DUF6879 family protein [Streptomyces sp. TBY4]|uniref:DUF6879 family protein n=1 Tax=Streptomyces sp. TBY4 TaxID=2962030 RepID=UPI0020B781F5|nr:DUF6879 family protein [Streptomyces sp. TBY4]MCP3755732.1 hypothetical protein [Streptomyces sp. TBY4]